MADDPGRVDVRRIPPQEPQQAIKRIDTIARPFGPSALLRSTMTVNAATFVNATAERDVAQAPGDLIRHPTTPAMTGSPFVALRQVPSDQWHA
jgi:hypothetical protein